MTTVHLQPPQPFDFSRPDEWCRWKRRFEQYRCASGLKGETEERQVSTLLYCLGETAEDTLNSTGISERERSTYNSVLTKFDDFFRVRKNVIFERACFNRRSQRDGETAEQFIAALYGLAESCEFGDFRDELMRDRLVVGIRDGALSERLQLDPSLTLEKAKTAVRQKEAVREQQQTLKNGSARNNPIVLEEVSGRQKGKQQADGPGREHRRWRENKHGPECTRCGKRHTKEERCPARDAVCHKCNRKGHFKSMCFSKSILELGSEKREELPQVSESERFDDPIPGERTLQWLHTRQPGTLGLSGE